MISLARKNTGCIQAGYVVGDFCDEAGLPEFDIVISCFSFQDMPDLKAACSTLLSVLGSDGVGVLVLEDYEYMKDVDAHRSTTRVWDTDPQNKQAASPPDRQRIYWDEEFYTLSWCRPTDSYLECLRQAGFVVTEVAQISTPPNVTKCVGIVVKKVIATVD